MDPATQSNGCENADLEIKLPAYHNELCAFSLQPQLPPDMKRNSIYQQWHLIFQEREVKLRCQVITS
jgi:hypothetical protein